MNRSTEHQQRVNEFMDYVAQNGGRPVPSSPTILPDEVAAQRLRFILDEYLEAVEAAGFELKMVGDFDDDSPLRITDFMFIRAKEPNLPELAKELADVSVVTIGAMSAYGIQDEPILEAVDENNIQKFTWPGGRYDAALGKWIKAPDHPKPKIAELLRDQGWEGANSAEGQSHAESNVP